MLDFEVVCHLFNSNMLITGEGVIDLGWHQGVKKKSLRSTAYTTEIDGMIVWTFCCVYIRLQVHEVREPPEEPKSWPE